MYLPATKQFGPEGSYLVVRSKLPPVALATSVMHTLRQINPSQAAVEFRSADVLTRDETVWSRRLIFGSALETASCCISNKRDAHATADQSQPGCCRVPDD